MARRPLPLLILMVFVAFVLATLPTGSDRFVHYLLQAEKDLQQVAEAKRLAIERGQPISIYLPRGILMDVIAVEGDEPLYALITNPTNPFQGGEILTFSQIRRRFNLENARINYGSGRIVNPHLGLPAASTQRIAPGDTLLLVVESSNDRVMAFDYATGDLVNPDFIPASGHLATPIEVRESPWGTFTISDQIADLVFQYDLNGAFLDTLAPAGGPNNAVLDNIRGHAYHPDSEHLLVTVASGANAHAVAEFDAAGNYLGNFIANGLGTLGGPWSILFRDTDVLVTGNVNQSVLRYDYSGNFLDIFAGVNSFPEQLARFSNGNIAVANFSGTQTGILIFTSTGSLIRVLLGVQANRGVAELGNGHVLTTNIYGVHEVDSVSGALIRTIVPGVQARFITRYVVPVVPVAPKLLISEFVVTPTAGEFIEIYNPGNDVVDLSNYYITDATYAPGNVYYYNIVTGSNAGGGGFADFHARFPDGATIAPGEYQTIALNGDSSFFATYGVMPTYELYEDGKSVPADAPDMREALPGSINNQGGLTNSDEVIILYYWDGLSDLVSDVDYVLYNTNSPVPNDEAVDKTGVALDGPDPDTLATAYLPDTPVANQQSAPSHGFGFSVHRIDYSEGAQIPGGGNGVTGADETSEDLNNTFTNNSIPSPNAPYAPLTYSLSGTVLLDDPTEPLAGTIVTLTGPVLQTVLTDTTDSTGAYGFTGLQSGTYDLNFHREGFRDFDTTVVVNANLVVDVTLHRLPAAVFFASLSGYQQVPPVQTPAYGFGAFELSADSSTLNYQIVIQRSDLIGQLTAAHFHEGAMGFTGPVVKTIQFAGDTASGVWSSADPEPLTGPLVESLLSGNLYINVHTDSFPGGEIRGQVLDTAAMVANPPQNLRAQPGVNFVDLAWDPPLPPGVREIAYDNGAEQGIGFVSTGEMAVRFTPDLYPARLLAIRVYWHDAGGGELNDVEYSVWTDPNGLNQGPVNQVLPNTPYTVPQRGVFSDILIGDQNLTISSGDFYYALIQPTPTNYQIGLDTDGPNAARSWVRFGQGSWALLQDFGFPDNLVIRALVLEGIGSQARLRWLNPADKPAVDSRQTSPYTKMNMKPDPRLSASRNRVQANALIPVSPRVAACTEGLMGFDIYRSTDNITFSLLASVNAAQLSYRDHTVTPNQTYYYYVVANYTFAQSGPSGVVSATPGAQEQLKLHSTPELVMGVTNKGFIGSLEGDLSAPRTPGFQWPVGTNQLFEGALVIGLPPDHVVDAARVIESSGAQAFMDEDFQFLDFLNTLADTPDSTVFSTTFDDSRANQPPLSADGPNAPIGLLIQQTTYSYTDPANSGYVIYRLEITNQSGTTLDSLLVGMYHDWDIDAFATNTGRVVFDTIVIPGINNGLPFLMEFAYEQDQGGTKFLGAVPLSQSLFRASRVADNADEIFPSGISPYTEANKYLYMLERRAQDPYGVGPYPTNADKSLIVGIGGGEPNSYPAPGFSLGPGESVVVGLAMVGGNSQSDFIANGKAALRKWVQLGGTVIPQDTALVGIPPTAGGRLPEQFALHPAFPNPFNPGTTIRYDLPRRTRVLVEVYNVAGQRIRTLVDAEQTPGYRTVYWDGTNDLHQPVASGIYFIRMQAEHFVQTRKAVLMK